MSITASSSLDNIVSRIEYSSFIRPRVTRFYQIRYRVGFDSLIQPRQYVQRSFSFNQIPIRIKNENVRVFQNERALESCELAKLNDKFAIYIEKINCLNTQNKKLEMECELLKASKKDTEKIRSMYEIEMQEVENLTKETAKDAESSDKLTKQNQSEAEASKKKYKEMIKKNLEDEEKIDTLCKFITQEEAEINLGKRRLANLNEKTLQLKNEVTRYFEEMKRVSSEIDHHTLNRVQLGADQDLLKEDLSRIKKNHEFQLNDIKKRIMSIQRPDIGKEFRAELAEAIRQIRNEFNKANSERCKQLQSQYKIQNIDLRYKKLDKSKLAMYDNQKKQLMENMRKQRVQIVNLKAQIAELEEKIIELEELKKSEEIKAKEKIQIKEMEIAGLKKSIREIKENLDLLANSNSDLKIEIKRYNDLLEGSENSQGLKQVLESMLVRKSQMIN